MRQSCPTGSKCCIDETRKDAPPYCAKECVSTMRFPHIEGITDEVSRASLQNLILLITFKIVANMCEGNDFAQ